MSRPPRPRRPAEDKPAPHRRPDRAHHGGAPIRIGQPRTVAISPQQHQQAVRALAAMIESWWRGLPADHQPLESEPPPQ